MLLLAILLQLTPVPSPAPPPPAGIDPIAMKLLEWVLALVSGGVIAAATIYFTKKKDTGDVVKAAMDGHSTEHRDHIARHDRFEEEIRTALQENLRAIAVVETQIGPFWKMIEHTVFPKFAGVIAPAEPNPVTEEQRQAMQIYVNDVEHSLPEHWYLARDGFEVEMNANPDLDADTMLLYSMAWFAVNGRIAEYEGGKIKRDGT